MPDSHLLNLHHLRYFYEIARTRNMKRAAARLGVSQPALSKQIQALEDALGFPLFHRSPKGMEPTLDGDVVFAHCERIFGHVRDLEEAIAALRSGAAGRLAVATVNSIGVHILPEYLRRYRAAHPEVRLKLITCRSAQVLQALREHRVDVGLVAGRPDADDMTAFNFVQNPMRVVVGAGHALATRTGAGPVDPAALDGEPMVAFDEDAPTRHIAEHAFAELGIEPEIVAESPDLEVIKRMVAIGVGFAVLPSHCVIRELAARDVVAVDVEGFELSRDLYVVHRATGGLPPAVEQFLTLFHEDPSAARVV